MNARPITLAEANRFVGLHHRHSLPRQGWKWGVGLINDTNELVAVAMAGRPSARALDDGYTLEVLRVCTLEDQPNANSHLYGRIARAAKALGYRRLITYTLQTESGASLRGAGFTIAAEVKDRDWHRPNRMKSSFTLFGRIQPTGDRYRWDRTL